MDGINIGIWWDKSEFEDFVRGDMRTKIDDLEVESDAHYAVVNDVIPRNTLVEPTAFRNYINRRLDELEGDKASLKAPERKLLKWADGKIPVSYAAVDQMRKNIGNGFKRQGVFKDEDQAILKQVYAALSLDQKNVAEKFGVGEELEKAKEALKKRKAVEDDIVSLGFQSSYSSLVFEINAAARGLGKGDATDFNKLMATLPKEYHREATGVMLHDIFTSGDEKQDSISSDFMTAFESLNKNKAAKDALFDYLPEGSKKRFDEIGLVATGVFSAKALDTSKTARDIIVDESLRYNKALIKVIYVCYICFIGFMFIGGDLAIIVLFLITFPLIKNWTGSFASRKNIARKNIKDLTWANNIENDIIDSEYIIWKNWKQSIGITKE